VAAPSLNESELRLLSALLRRNVRFMVVGLSAAALQGAPVVTQDVDLWFEDLHNPKIAEALREVGAAYVPPSILNPPMFGAGGIELFDIVLRMDGFGSFNEEFANCVEVPLGTHKLKVLRLERILVSKRAANLAKDRLVVPVLEDAVAVNTVLERSGRKRHSSRRRKRRE
jgi:hypothetical protein